MVEIALGLIALTALGSAIVVAAATVGIIGVAVYSWLRHKWR